jgi:ABC-type nitrate/sulfonate/bicarbonate transport system substrate-binding protein
MTNRRSVLLAPLAWLAPWPLCAQTPQADIGLTISGGVGNLTPARAAIALRAAAQSVIWIGAEAGIFRKHGVDLKLTLDTGGPRAAAGTIKGDWEFCHTGDTPVVLGVLKGQDPVLIVGVTEPHDIAFLMTRRDITKPEHLAGARIGGVDAKGQFGKYVEGLLNKWGVSATVLTLGSFKAIYEALGKGEVDAGYLPVDLRFMGQKEFGWNSLAGIPIGAGGIVTTRRLIVADRELVSRFVKASVETIALFKTRPDVVIPLLQKHLQINDREAVETLHDYYVPLFRSIPRPTFESDLPGLKATFSREYPAAENLRSDDLCDASFVADLERTGYIDKLYRS